MVAKKFKQIPLHEDIFVLSKAFKQSGFQLFVVGGAVRDFLMSNDPENFQPKDIDLATDAQPSEVAQLLDDHQISNRPQGEAFGVWIAHIVDREYEIATFREDGEYSDGRRPDSVSFCDAEADYKRRDLTINGLFYEIPKSNDLMGVVYDYGNGAGFADLADFRIRTIGNPVDRFQEDRLRVMRAIRFHARYHAVSAEEVFDAGMLNAIARFKTLEGVSAPRIYQEFMAGINKALHVPNLIRSYHNLELMPAIFPAIYNNGHMVHDQILLHLPEDGRNIAVILASMFVHVDPELVRSCLNEMCWPNDVSNEVRYLLNVFQAELEEVYRFARKLTDVRRQNLSDFVDVVHRLDQKKHRDVYEYLIGYEIPEFGGDFITDQFGIEPGPEMGEKQRELHKQHFLNGYNSF